MQHAVRYLFITAVTAEITKNEWFQWCLRYGALVSEDFDK